MLACSSENKTKKKRSSRSSSVFDGRSARLGVPAARLKSEAKLFGNYWRCWRCGAIAVRAIAVRAIAVRARVDQWCFVALELLNLTVAPTLVDE